MKFPPNSGKSARNEIRKIRATFYNNVAVGLMVTSFFIPVFGVMLNSEKIADRFRGGLSPSSAELRYGLVFLIIIFLAYYTSVSFRRFAITELSQVED